MDDSLKINQNSDGSFSLEWDKEDPKWNWLNGLTSKEIEVMLEKAIQHYSHETDKPSI
jgi:hypothetical protein